MEVPDTESNSRGLASVIRGERVINRISLSGNDGRPFRLRVRSFGWVRNLFEAHQSPGQSGTVNWFELSLTLFAWVLMGGAVAGLLYFCYRVVMFVRDN